jgi:hypothetical protein
MPSEIPALSWTRRAVLRGAALLVGTAAFTPRRLFAAEPSFALPKATAEALAKSSLVYVSPLLASGKQSSCHKEVWYFWDRDAVVIGTATDRWKTVTVTKGRDKARIWVGEYGSSAPSFTAHASIDKDPATFARMLVAYATRYPDEWESKWKARFESSYKDGSRSVIRYTPISA